MDMTYRRDNVDGVKVPRNGGFYIWQEIPSNQLSRLRQMFSQLNGELDKYSKGLKYVMENDVHAVLSST